MTLDRDAIQEISKLTRGQDVLLPLPGPGAAFLVMNPLTGEIVQSGAALGTPPVLTFHSTEHFVDHVVETFTALGKAPDRVLSLTPANIYYSRKGLQARFYTPGTDPLDVRSSPWGATLPLANHPAFTELEALQRSRDFTQSQLVNFLRAKLNGHVKEETIQHFRHLKLVGDSQGTQVKAQGHESVGKSIQQKVLTEIGGVIPDEITVQVPVYDLDEVRDELYSVTVLVDVEPDEDGRAVFTLTTVQNTLRKAEFDALEHIVEQVVEHLHSYSTEAIALAHADLK